MTRNAHPTREIAQQRSANALFGLAFRASLSVVLVIGLLQEKTAAQATNVHAAAVITVPHEAELQNLLQSSDPRLRGEAALGLSLTQKAEYYPAILEIARDRAAAANQRGTVALGQIASPGADHALGVILESTRPNDPQNHAAAYALGLIPAGQPNPALDAYFDRIQGGSYRRHRDSLSALICALAQHEHPAYLLRIKDILEDESNKDPGLRILAFEFVRRQAEGLSTEELQQMLQDKTRAGRAVHAPILQSFLHGTVKVDRSVMPLVVRLAKRSPLAPVRALSLRILVRERQLVALELAPGALRSKHRHEIQAGVHSILTLGGGMLRESLEQRILGQKGDSAQAAMLDAWTIRPPKSLANASYAIASDTSRSPELRVAAALLVARAHDKRAISALRRLAHPLRDPLTLTRIYKQLIALDAGEDLPKAIYPKATEALAAFAPRLTALFAAGHEDAISALRRALKDDRFTSECRADLLQSWRRTATRKTADKVLQQLPSSLAHILR